MCIRDRYQQQQQQRQQQQAQQIDGPSPAATSGRFVQPQGLGNSQYSAPAATTAGFEDEEQANPMYGDQAPLQDDQHQEYNAEAPAQEAPVSQGSRRGSAAEVQQGNNASASAPAIREAAPQQRGAPNQQAQQGGAQQSAAQQGGAQQQHSGAAEEQAVPEESDEGALESTQGYTPAQLARQSVFAPQDPAGEVAAAEEEFAEYVQSPDGKPEDNTQASHVKEYGAKIRKIRQEQIQKDTSDKGRSGSGIGILPRRERILNVRYLTNTIKETSKSQNTLLESKVRSLFIQHLKEEQEGGGKQ
eukprot:TRINITY_DN9256_c0_g3_i2.p1 TRINITY_DN9256_c0_g3~~TRINITY_DN9256_c0_g3_i2.p1  ORF type:complete len:302 (+),score=114.57 TRINITY_DN9256_c0_g3_i2:66-971(+)